jgi:hypothetical protein
MNNIPNAQISGYLTALQIGNDFISIRDRNYSPESVNPTSSGRFHIEGQLTYYIGSGNVTPMLEKDLDLNEPLPAHLQKCAMPSGVYNAFDLSQYVAQHPEYSDYFYGKNGWDNCQELRKICESCNISGIYYDSQKNPGGQNLVIWPLTGTEMNSGYFRLNDNT